eukprot:6007755-Amphidinium_carterae.2
MSVNYRVGFTMLSQEDGTSDNVSRTHSDIVDESNAALPISSVVSLTWATSFRYKVIRCFSGLCIVRLTAGVGTLPPFSWLLLPAAKLLS